jgi:hypothetical protein
MIGKYSIGKVVISSDDDLFPSFVKNAYLDKIIPLCLCQESGDPLKLYIALRHDNHVVARYPGTGHLHNPKCDHYDAPEHLTGFGHVNGSAIVEDNASGDICLKFGFPMSIGAARLAPTALTNDNPILKITGTKLSIRGLLHFLWDKAQLTHWHPAMFGKRNWYIVRREILNAAHSCTVKSQALYSSIFLPENFAIDKIDDIKARAQSVLGPCISSPEKIMIMIGEVKEIRPAHYGHKLVILHSADRSVNLDYDEWRRFEKRFAVELALWMNADSGHLIFAGSFSITKQGLMRFYEMTIMPVTDEWLPYDDREEFELLRKAVSSKRRFVKGLRYNLDRDKPIASITLRDTGQTVTAVHLSKSRPNPEYDSALQDLMAMPGVNHIVWTPGLSLPD